jgi:site-specific recombinase XerD
MNITFSYLVTSFFTTYLASERGLSPNTIASYSDCMKLLVNYICKRFGIETEALEIQMITAELILDFLDNLEDDRSNAPATRNQRLATIRTFFHFLARSVPELMHQNERIQAIKPKKTTHIPPPSLTVEEVAAILAVPDSATMLGARDKALLQIMYNTGARVQELADLTMTDLRFECPATVTLTGKGNKTRVIPLWQETVEHIRHYMALRTEAGTESEYIFLNNKGEPITRFGIGRRLEKHAKTAAKQYPSLRNRRITPHVIRHTTALHLIEAGNDIFIVKDWLGHVDIKTTSQYVEISIDRKRKALEKMPPPDGDSPPEISVWKQPNLIKFLNKCSSKAHYVA